MRVVITLIVVCALALGCLVARAHDFWSNGLPVPAWVKSQCCGPNDVHMLRDSSVHVMADGYHIDGLANVIPTSRAVPSADGHYWIFFKESDGPNEHVYCFFAPLSGS